MAPSLVCKWHHQFSQLLKPTRTILDLFFSSILNSATNPVASTFEIYPRWDHSSLSSWLALKSHMDYCICCLTDVSASTLVLLNFVYSTVARSVLQKKIKIKNKILLISKLSNGTRIKSHVCILPTGPMTSQISCPNSLPFDHSTLSLPTSQMFFQHTEHALCNLISHFL